MKKAMFFMAFIALHAALLNAQTADAPSSGDGSSGNPYQIATLNNLYWITQNASEWDKYYIQTADIDASGTSAWDGGAGFSPIGNGTTNFTGSYDGDGHTISDLSIDRSSIDYTGLFGYTSGGTIQNLGVTTVNITGNNFSGGLIGRNYSTVSNCYSTGSVSGSVSTGGLLGFHTTSNVSDCYSTCSVSGSTYVGGMVGYVDGGAVINCYCTGIVSGSSSVGGFIGNRDSGSVTDCFWDTATSGTTTGTGGGITGGVTGKTTAEMNTLSTFTNVGTAGLTTAWDFEIDPYDDAASHDYWDMDLSGTINSGYPFLSWENGGAVALTITPSGSGTSGDPYLIATLDNLWWLSQNSTEWSAYYSQTADIDASSTSAWSGGAGFSPIGNMYTQFTGSYDGNGFIIGGLFIDLPASDFVGLFGQASGGTIQDLGVTDVDMSGRGAVGGLMGSLASGGTVTNCYSTGAVLGYGSSECLPGGLVGALYEGTVNNCYSLCSVSGVVSSMGGLIGYLYDGCTVNNCYSAGSVSGSTDAGGLIGWDYWNGTNTVTNAFWDTQTSGQSSSDGGTGKTTAEMKTVATFTDVSTSGLTAAWDFETDPNDDSANDDYWDMDLTGTLNSGYPFLSWQNGTDVALPEPPSSGDGTSGDPYQIATLDNLYWLMMNPSEWDMYYIQTADIDASNTSTWDSGAGFSPVGNASVYFTGNYNGDSKIISNLFISRSAEANIGLFGVVNGATIQDLGLTAVNITGGGPVGGFAAKWVSGSLNNCSCVGSVSGGGNTGGLIGQIDGGTISNCYSSSSVTSTGPFSDAGGLCAKLNGGTVNSCYSAGSVSGDEFAGGLMGDCGSGTLNNCYSRSSVACLMGFAGGFIGNFNGVTVNHCYSTGNKTGMGLFGGFMGIYNVGTITDSFWDTQTSGTTNADALGMPVSGITGKNTAQMKTKSTFTDSGWDFEVETTNGTNDDWDMDLSQVMNNGYPFLSWQNGSDVALDDVLLSVNVLLEGPYNTATDEMNVNLSSYIPTTSPYADARSVSSIPSNVVDWVYVEIRSTTTTVDAARSAFLYKDGTIVNDNGTSAIIPMDAGMGSYYIVVAHRNHLAVMSAVSQALNTGSTTQYDFTDNSTKYYGGTLGAVALETGVWGMITGDANANGEVQADDKENVWRIEVGLPGYRDSDFNMNGEVQADDKESYWRVTVGRGSQVP